MSTARVTPTPAQMLSEEVKYTQDENAPLVIFRLPSYPSAPRCSFLTLCNTSPPILCSPTFYQIQPPSRTGHQRCNCVQGAVESSASPRDQAWPFKGTVALSEGPVLGSDPVSGRTSLKGSNAPRLPWGSNQFPCPPEAGELSANLAAHGRRLDTSPDEGTPWMCPL